MPTRKTREQLDNEMREMQRGSRPSASEPGPDPEAASGGDAAATTPPQLLTLIESLLFAAGAPLPAKSLLAALQDFHPGLSSHQLRHAVEELQVTLREGGRGIRVAEVAQGYQLRTPSEAAPYIKKLVSRRPPRLTKPTLETLAIVAYRQPVTRGEVEEIRGVDSGAVLRHLLEKRLVRILGRKDEPGRPLLYGTTKEFLEFFSLKDLGSLPTLREFTELSEEHRASLGLPPLPPQGDEVPAEAADPIFQVEITDAYAPVGDDQVVQELAEALADVRSKNRAISKTLPKPREETSDRQDADPQPEKPQPEQPRPMTSEPGPTEEGGSD